ncbi:Nucleotidyltransferase domain-containing protein [Caloramator quimbayensis]|uniref:Nucleotidyltransferase domain-containing protein n=1 Tax=Caloramator quimbayensis TaxID=1147123 RepID=A0A1T4WE19_9CLOT|nr:nucleotidyltransferase domain-containing protein [Caloramator quimbayensis]SKA75572.1 Nucleotidyltransferase domain-containing protein [Caloramator quimbayensis]
MIRYKKVDFNFVYSNIAQLKKIFDKYGDKIDAAYLFGSVHKRTVNPLSDIDIAILINIQYEYMSNMIEEEVFEDISRCLKTDEIDLICLNNAPLSMQYGVIKDKEILYYYDKQKLIDYETMIIMNYLDIKPMRDSLNFEFLKKVGE